MYFVYILYSPSAGKTYTGYTNNVARRLIEHNITESKGFTLRYRPWVIIHTESFQNKQQAMDREKFLKTGRGREEVKAFVTDFLGRNGAVSAAAEMD